MQLRGVRGFVASSVCLDEVNVNSLWVLFLRFMEGSEAAAAAAAVVHYNNTFHSLLGSKASVLYCLAL